VQIKLMIAAARLPLRSDPANNQIGNPPSPLQILVSNPAQPIQSRLKSRAARLIDYTGLKQS
jgi:hypothetical protein